MKPCCVMLCVPLFLKSGLIGAHIGLEFQALCKCIWRDRYGLETRKLTQLTSVFSDLNAGFQDRAEDLSLSFQPFRFMSRVNTWQIQSLFNHGMGNWKTWKWSQPEVLMFMPWPLGLAVRNLSRSLQPLVTTLATASCFRKRGHIWSLINLHIINLMLSNVVKDRRTEVTCILQLWIDRDPFASGLSLCLI